MEGSFSDTTPNMTNGEGANAPVAPTWVPVSWSSIHHTPHGSTLTLPAGEQFLSADFSRTASDLLIETPSGAHFVVENFFTFAYPPALETAHGAILTADLLTTLAGPLAPNMMAQVGQNPVNTLGASIGQVNESQGQVTVTHADGAQEALTLGSFIYQGDVLETGPKGSTSVVFVDDTIFTLSENGRMVMDEMVYDPGTQTGVFSAQILQGVFSFVSGKVAKTSPDGMVISTPTNTIGIRGSTVLGEAAPDGLPNHVILIRDVNGNVGELVISNGGGTIVLNQAGSSTTIFNAASAPGPMVFLSPQDIQQNYGAALTNLIKAVAQKADQDTQEAAKNSQKADQDAEQAQQDAADAEQEAAQAGAQADQAQADADAAQAEAEDTQAQAETLAAEAAAAKVAAEAFGDEEAIAQAAELEAQAAQAQQQAEEAQQQAEAEGAQAAEAQQQAETAQAQAQLQGEAAAQAQQQAVQAQVQAEQTAQFNTMAQSASETQQQVFTQFLETGFVDPNMAPGMAPGAVPPPPGDGPGPDDQAIDQAAQDAAQQALAEGATPEEAAAAAFEAAKEQAIAEGATPEEIAAAELAYNEALAAGLSPEEAMLAAKASVVQPLDVGQNDILGPVPGTIVDGGTVIPGGTIGDTFDTLDPYFTGTLDPYFTGDPYADLFTLGLDFYATDGDLLFFNDPLFFDPYAYDIFYADEFFYDPFTDPNIIQTFGETIFAASGGGALSGTTLNTNFYFSHGNVSGDYTVNSSGGVNQLSYDNLNNVTVKFQTDAGLNTSGVVTIWDGFAPNSLTSLATVTFSNISQVLLSDGLVSGFASTDFQTAGSTDILVLPVLSAGETGYVIAGTSGADAITINQTFHGAIVFGKGDGDTFNINTTGDLTAIGGITATDNLDDGNNGGTLNDGIPDSFINLFSYSSFATAITAILSNTDAIVAPLSGTSFVHDLWDVGSFTATALADTLNISSSYNTIDAGAGDDTITVRGGANYLSILGGTGNDELIVYNTEYAALDLAKITDAGGTNTFTMSTFFGGTYSMNTYSAAYATASAGGFTLAKFSGEHAGGAITVTALATASILNGSVHNDTLLGGLGNDTIIGGIGNDTLTGGTGADIFTYTATDQLGDTITDFVDADDTLSFSRAAFNGDGNSDGALDVLGTSATSGVTSSAAAGEYFIFNSADNKLFYDADADGAGAGVEVVDIGAAFLSVGNVVFVA
ncbi:MAG: hypothetical protein COB46_05190 [Rhodospirillaceae bacterium]|nr:MAG: hypothetical protein COB46_05190 [Rhodospirillaceae bacterium]